MSVPVILDNIIRKNEFYKEKAKLMEHYANKNLYYSSYINLEVNFDHTQPMMVENFLEDLYLYHMKLQGVAYVENCPISQKFKDSFLEILKSIDPKANLKKNKILKLNKNGKPLLLQDYIISSSTLSGDYFERMFQDLVIDDEFPKLKVHSLDKLILPEKRKFFVLKEAEFLNHVLLFLLKLLACIILFIYLSVSLFTK
jgi:hypothetical protein